MDSTPQDASSIRPILNVPRLWGTIALTWSIASLVAADTLRWRGMVDPPQLDAAFVVFSIDTDLQKATIASLPWNLPATTLEHNSQFWTGHIGGQQIAVMGSGEAGKSYTIEMMKIGPVGPAKGTLQWMPPLGSIEGVRAFGGSLDLPGMELDITIRLAEVNGALQAEIDIPLQLVDATPLRMMASDGMQHTLAIDAPTPAEMIVTETPSGLTGTLDEYPRIETTFDPTTMAIITNWIRTQVGLTQ